MIYFMTMVSMIVCHKQLNLCIASSYNALHALYLLPTSLLKARAGMLDITEVLQLFKKFVDVTSFVVWESLIENLSVLDRLFSCTTYYEDFKRYVVNLLTPIAKKLGWDASENESKHDW